MNELAARALAALDLTSLGEDDDAARIEALCESARMPIGAPAALCVYPEWICSARVGLDARGLSAVRVATVVNFPDGGADADRASRETRRAVAAGADEIDMVLPWRALQSDDEDTVLGVLSACREAASKRTLKVILETGELQQLPLISRASELAIAQGADFIKTSTGKVAINATLPAAEIMLRVIAANGGRCGFKAAGGIRTVEDAAAYFALADRILGPHWATAEHFRLGASGLLDDIRARLAGQEGTRGSHAY